MEDSQKIRIDGTNETDVAYALAYLAGFPKGSFIGRTNNIYHREFKECLVGFHKETLDKAGPDHPMLLGPDFIVTRVKRPPKDDEGINWVPTDEYLIDLGPIIDSSLIGKISEEIKLAYSEVGAGERAD